MWGLPPSSYGMQSQLNFVSFLPGFGVLARYPMNVQGKTLLLLCARDLAPDRDIFTFKKLRITSLVLSFCWLFWQWFRVEFWDQRLFRGYDWLLLFFPWKVEALYSFLSLWRVPLITVCKLGLIPTKSQVRHSGSCYICNFRYTDLLTLRLEQE